MPSIREYRSKETLQTSDKGYQAYEMEGRRIGPLYQQAAADYEKIGKLENQAIGAKALLYQKADAGTTDSGKAKSGSSSSGSGGSNGVGGLKLKDEPKAKTPSYKEAAALTDVASKEVTETKKEKDDREAGFAKRQFPEIGGRSVPSSAGSRGSQASYTDPGGRGSDFIGSTEPGSDVGKGLTPDSFDYSGDKGPSLDEVNYWRRWDGKPEINSLDQMSSSDIEPHKLDFGNQSESVISSIAKGISNLFGGGSSDDTNDQFIIPGTDVPLNSSSSFSTGTRDLGGDASEPAAAPAPVSLDYAAGGF